MLEHFIANRQATENVALRYASKDSNDVIGKTNLHVRFEHSLTQEKFHIVYSLAVSIFLETSLIDKNIFGILPQSRNVVPCTSKPVS